MDEDIIEFNIAHNRMYSTDHLWFQDKDDRWMIGVSEFLLAEVGDVLRIILPDQDAELDEGQDLFSLWTADEKITFSAPFSGMVVEVNGEVESNPELANDSPYDLGWILILDPHVATQDVLLEAEEYIDHLAEG